MRGHTLVKRKGEPPKRAPTKRQLATWQRERRRQRIILILGIIIIVIILGLVIYAAVA